MGSQRAAAREEWRRALLEGSADARCSLPSVARALREYWEGARATPPPAPPPIDELGASLEPYAACLLAASAVRAAWPSFGAVDLSAWLAVFDAFAAEDPECRARSVIARGWLALVRGEDASAREAFEEGRTRAREASVVDAYLEASAAWVIAALELGAIGEALERARRTARSARAEALPWLELLAYVTLARARRMSGAPQFAAHVLRGIGPLAPRAWRRAITWERELSGVRSSEERGDIGALLEAIDGGASADRACEEAARISAPVAFLAADTRALACALGGRGRPSGGGATHMTDASQSVRAWSEGSSALVPRGLHALGRGEHDDLAYVAAGAGPARRVLSRARRAMGWAVLEPDRTPQLRTHALLARLAWAAPSWLSEEALFLDLYGFEHDRVRHKQILDTLVHRARAKAASVATLERGGGKLRLIFQRPALVWDPSCRWSVEDRVVAHIASAGACSARAIAAELSLPIRTVQAHLRDLTESESCQARRDGRNIVYVVEDTCFSELTRQRFLALSSPQGESAR